LADNDSDNAFINDLWPKKAKWPKTANEKAKRKTQTHKGIHSNNITYMKYEAIYT